MSMLLKDKRIAIIMNDKNIGLTASLNKALKYCDGDYSCKNGFRWHIDAK